MHPVSIPASNPGPMTGEGNHTWLIPGAPTLLVDAGVGAAQHLDALRVELARAGTGLGTVVVTHAHPDHIEGTPAVHATWPKADLRKYPWPTMDAKYPVSFGALDDQQRIAAGDEELVAIYTPGHSPDHLCLWHEASRTLFGGDLVIEGGTVVIPASRGGRLIAYMRSLERVLALDAAVILPAHGPTIVDPAKIILATLAHRRRREAQVLEGLARGPATPASLASTIYDRLPAAAQRLGQESVLAHLLKLQEEGLVSADGEFFRLKP